MSIDSKVSIIVLDYNNFPRTKACLDSLKNLDYPDYDIIIVDNASETGDRQALETYLRSYPQQYVFLKNEINNGYAGGNNLGIAYAMQHSNSRYLLILNNDTVIQPDCLNNLIKKIESDSRIGLVGPIIDEVTHKTYGGKISWLTPELKHINTQCTSPSTSSHHDLSVGFLTGACLLIRSETIEKIGNFDERYFLYFEDADLCLRARKAGYKLALDENTLIRHYVSSTTGSLGPARLLRLHYRNAHLFNLKNGPLYIKVLLPFWSLYGILKQLIKIVFLPSKRSISKAILLGILDFYKGNWGKLS